jgi:hypothetical protein
MVTHISRSRRGREETGFWGEFERQARVTTHDPVSRERDQRDGGDQSDGGDLISFTRGMVFVEIKMRFMASFWPMI